MATVELSRLVKSFSGQRVVDAVDLAIRDGELLVLVGPSGCGKTTTLRMIAGLETPDSGEIRIGSHPVDRVAPRDRDVAMVFQNYALYPHMTVRKNLGFALRMRRVRRPEIARRVAAVAEMLEIAELLERRPSQLSGGQQQRVALGRAAVRQPAVFLLDEPLSNLDAKLRTLMRTELVRLHRRIGTTMIYVTHDQTEAMMMGDQIVVMNKGRIEQAGPPVDVYQRPATRFVAEFIGTPPMNFLAGRFDGRRLTIGETSVPWRNDQASSEASTTAPNRPLGAQDAQAVTVGLRPEHITVHPAGGDTPADSLDAFRLSAEVELVQPMGADTLLQCRWHEHLLTATIRADVFPTVGQAVVLISDTRYLHVFDELSGHRL